ncbi:rRNA adenine N-6-methyltransferase family protein, partial [Sphingomonas sp. NPDC019816]|uniref:rRNA adenine N-6-methyltransferase family protein n=1 Tax=Sphingomonas sp. NPDC019816 TaxID=3390679 RepID=UPI003D00497C
MRVHGAGSMLAVALLLALGGAVAGCDGSKPLINQQADDDRPGPFPAADRPVADVVSSRWSSEDARDRLREADQVMDRANIKPGMTVADIGAGEGYYTVRLAQRVGKEGRVLAEDIVAAWRDRLAEKKKKRAEKHTS